MADTSRIPGLKKKGKAFFIERPRRGKAPMQTPEQVIDTLLTALRDMASDSAELVVVPEDDLSEPRIFEKPHQATNYGRKLLEALEEREPSLRNQNGEKIEHLVSISTPPVERDETGKPIGPFLLALGRK
jgi:hypothetical protein